jgi:hypothetical protein
MSLKAIRAVGAAAACTFLAACATMGDMTKPASSSSAWARFEADFIEASFWHSPAMAASQGRHEFDGELPDWRSHQVDPVPEVDDRRGGRLPKPLRPRKVRARLSALGRARPAVLA